MFVEPPEGFSFVANRPSSFFEDYSIPPVYQPMRRIGVNLAGHVFQAIDSPRRIPILTRCDLVHVDGSMLPITRRPWIVGAIEYASALFSFDDRWYARPTMRHSLVRILSGPRCKKVLTYSEAALNSLRLGLGKEFKDIEPKCGVIPQVIPTKYLRRHPAKRDDASRVSILFVGNHFFDKGGRELFFAFKRLKRKFDVELILVTDAPAHHRSYFDSFKEIIRREEGVTLHTRIPRKILWDECYAKADIFCMPTYMDTFGYVLLEAMANRLPIVSSDMFAVPEIVRDGETGLLVHVPVSSFERDVLRTPESVMKYREAVLNERLFGQVVDSLEVSLGRLIEDDQMRRRMSEAAFREVEQGRLSVAHRNSQLRQVYLESTS